MEDPTDDDASGLQSLTADNYSDTVNFMFDATGGPAIVTPDDRTVNYVFPVEVIVIGALTEEDHRAIERRIWTNFGEAFSQQSA